MIWRVCVLLRSPTLLLPPPLPLLPLLLRRVHRGEEAEALVARVAAAKAVEGEAEARRRVYQRRRSDGRGIRPYGPGASVSRMRALELRRRVRSEPRWLLLALHTAGEGSGQQGRAPVMRRV